MMKKKIGTNVFISESIDIGDEFSIGQNNVILARDIIIGTNVSIGSNNKIVVNDSFSVDDTTYFGNNNLIEGRSAKIGKNICYFCCDNKKKNEFSAVNAGKIIDFHNKT